MNHSLLFLGAALALVVNAVSAAEQKQVFRCGQTYQDSPCPGGKAIDVNDERSAEQREASIATTRTAAELGTRLERDRLAQERALRSAQIVKRSTRSKTRQIAAERRPTVVATPKAEKAIIINRPPPAAHAAKAKKRS